MLLISVITTFSPSSMLVVEFYYTSILLIFDCKGMDKNESKKELALE